MRVVPLEAFRDKVSFAVAVGAVTARKSQL